MGRWMHEGVRASYEEAFGEPKARAGRGKSEVGGYERLAVWRAGRLGSSTVEGRKRKVGETRGRKKKYI